ncbi:MAG TPA: glycosyltransferase family 1 protein [Pedomonas sp.]|uniref:glycosyltransferase family 4 protein n=1 Tax=Pedomonas sp. TaxID=2976421 RepID=UPI002F3F4928
MRITIVTDAWAPQINGVVRTLQTIVGKLEARGHTVQLITPSLFRSLPCPTYPEIRLALAPRREVAKRIAEFSPDAIHIATEGPLGIAARHACLKNALPFTTAFHTRFPEYVSARTRLPADWFWHYIRWFHAPAQRILTATPRLAEELHARGLPHTAQWTRGVDLSRFHPDAQPHPALAALPRPVQLYVGRVAIEKNLEAFLQTRHPGTKVIVGDGPALPALRQKYPDAVFLGPLQGEALAGTYANADVFVFPSETDTFGLVMIEALASGLPVAALPVPGPLDVIGVDGRGTVRGWHAPVGSLHDNLEIAIGAALRCNRNACARYAGNFSWEESTRQFLAALTPITPVALAA